MRTIPTILCFMFWTTVVGPAWAERYAIVVGVNECPKFRLPDGAKPRPLRGAENDADEIAYTLARQFKFDRQHIHVLKGPEATYQELKSKFQRVAEQTRPDDVFVFHFSGHGTQYPDRRPFDETDRLDEALCMFDATAHGENLLLDDQLGLWLDDIQARQITVILDCCHSGTGIKDPDDAVVPRYLPIKLPGPRPSASNEPWRELRSGTKSFGRRLTAFFACRSDQQAYERRLLDFRPPKRIGQFSHYLLEALKNSQADVDHDGSISNQEAYDYAAIRLDETFNRTRSEPARQTPVIETETANSPLFGVRRTDAGDHSSKGSTGKLVP